MSKRFERVLLKLSGESLCAPGGFGVEPAGLRAIAEQIIDAKRTGVDIAVVVGGGNIIRGAQLAREGLIHRASADQMGMLGTLINGIALREALTNLGQDARCMTAVSAPAVAEPLIRLRAIRHMEKGRVVILAGGTGNPFFTTDTTAALRAVELECDVLMKATKVDGVYSADPKKDANATRFDTLTFRKALEMGLQIMDATAFTMCQEHRLPVLVFDFARPGNVRAAIEKIGIGTLITHD